MNVLENQTPRVMLSDLTPEQKKQLLADALAEERNAKTKKNEQREAYKALVEETVPKVIFKLCTASEILSNAKRETFEYFEDILKLKQEVYGLKEKQRSHTFSTDKEDITIGYRINDGWDDTVHAGIEKVTNYIKSLATNKETAALTEMVFNLLKKDDKGNLKSNRVLDLQKLTDKINNEEFSDGVDIISKAFKPTRSSWFIEASILNGVGKKTNIPLSMSSAEFPGGYSFNFYTEPKEDEPA